MTTNITAGEAGTWRLGGDTPVARMGFGAMRLPAWPAGRQPSRDEAIAVLRRAVELGVNHIDTASFYARDGVSANELIKAALHPYPAGLVLVSKIGPRLGADPTSTRAATTVAELREDLERNLTELGVDQLDMVNLRVGSMEVHDGPIGPQFEALATLREEGLVKHLGISNVALSHLDEARRIAPVASVQNLFNIQRQEDSALVDRCAADGVSYVPFFPLGGFELVGDPAIGKVAQRHGASVAQIALAWLLARSPSVLLIPGTSTVAHLEDNIAAAGITLSADDLRDLEAVAAPVGR